MRSWIITRRPFYGISNWTRLADIEQLQALQSSALGQLNVESEVMFWCEAGAHDQLLLLLQLTSLSSLPDRPELIEIASVPRVERLIGIGPLAPDLLDWLWLPNAASRG